MPGEDHGKAGHLYSCPAQVRRVEYKVDDMQGYAQWSLERACVKECDPFCVSMGGRTKVGAGGGSAQSTVT